MNYPGGPQGPHDEIIYKVLVAMVLLLVSSAFVAAAIFDMLY